MVETLQERLRWEADGEAAASRTLSDAKYGPNYQSLSKENTTRWKAAAELDRLTAELKQATEELDTLRGALRTAEQPRPHNLRTLR